MKHWSNYISVDPDILFGKPVIKKTRIPVDLILEKLSTGESVEQLLQAYPNLNAKAIFACLKFAAESVRNQITYKIAS